MEVTASPAAVPRSQWMTFFLIALNVVVYLFLIQSGGSNYDNLILFGAKENGLIAEGQFERLFFPMFLHANLLHLVFNMWGLYQVGRALEVMIGSKRLLFLYLAAGLTGNLASFAFVDPMSVGASGALFGFLSCLWVVQKYEEKLLEEMNEPIQKSTIGMLILFNFAISFIIPNIDWACHLGGCVAGILIGLAMVMRHRVSIRQLRMARFLGSLSVSPKTPIWEHQSLYFILLGVLNFGLAAGYLRVKSSARAFGLGTFAASHNSTEPKSIDSLASFRILVGSPGSESNPERLLGTALKLHSSNAFSSATAVYDVLLDIHPHGLGTEEFVSQTTRTALVAARGFALQAEPLSEELTSTLAHVTKETAQEPIQVCQEAGNLLRTIGFFGLAGRLFECAFYLDTRSVQTAADVFECYWKSEDELKKQATRFRYVLERLEEQPH